MSRKTPTTRDLRGRTVFTRSETHDLPPQEGADNPWDLMLKGDEQWQHQTQPLPVFNWAMIAAALIFAGVVIGAVLLLR